MHGAQASQVWGVALRAPSNGATWPQHRQTIHLLRHVGSPMYPTDARYGAGEACSACVYAVRSIAAERYVPCEDADELLCDWLEETTLNDPWEVRRHIGLFHLRVSKSQMPCMHVLRMPCMHASHLRSMLPRSCSLCCMIRCMVHIPHSTCEPVPVDLRRPR